MHEEEEKEANKNESMCSPAKIAFVEDTFLKEQIDEYGFDEKNNSGAKECGEYTLER